MLSLCQIEIVALPGMGAGTRHPTRAVHVDRLRANLNVGMHRANHRHSEELRCQNEESADAVQGAVQHVRLLSPNCVSNQHLII